MSDRVEIIDSMRRPGDQPAGDSRLIKSGADFELACVVNPNLDRLQDRRGQRSATEADHIDRSGYPLGPELETRVQLTA